MAAGVEGERPLSHGTGACAHAARDAVERDAALRLELEDPQVHARPAVGGRDERARLAGVRAGHVGARDARLDAGVDHRRAGGGPGAGRRLDDPGHCPSGSPPAAPRSASSRPALSPDGASPTPPPSPIPSCTTAPAATTGSPSCPRPRRPRTPRTPTSARYPDRAAGPTAWLRG